MDLMAPSKVTICGGSTTEGPMLCLSRSYRSPQPSWWWQWCHGSRTCWWCASRAIGKGRGGTTSKVAMLGWRASEWSIFWTKIGMQQTRGKEMYTGNHWHLTFRMTLSQVKKIMSCLGCELRFQESFVKMVKAWKTSKRCTRASRTSHTGEAREWHCLFLPKDDYLKNGHWGQLSGTPSANGHPLNFWGFNIR